MISTHSTAISLSAPTFPALTAKFALAAAAIVVLMFATFLLTGIGQDPLQYVHPPEQYVAIAIKNPPVLRLAIGLDNLFIVLYSSMFLTLGAALWKRTGSNALLVASLSLLAVTSAMDLMENMHFLTMMSQAVQGIGIGQAQIDFQVWESLVKFHLSYLGLFLLGFALPHATLLEKILCFALRWVQLPIGLLIYLTPASVATPLVMARFTFFLAALLAIALIFRHRQSCSSEPA